MKEWKFKMTEIGLIPQDWDICKIKDVCSTNTGNKNTQDKVDGGKYPFYVRSNTIERINTFTHEGEAVLTAGDGVGTGKVFHYAQGKFAVHQRVYIMNRFEKVDGKFFYWYFANNFLDRVSSMTAKSSVDSVRKEMITEMLIPISPLDEQTRIASALSEVDALLSSLDKMIAKKQAIKEGTMQQLLTRKTRLEGFDEEWKEYSIEELFDLGNGYTPSKEVPEFWNNGSIPWFRMEDIRKNGRILKDSIQHITPLAVKGGRLFPKNSIIISTTATIGEHALLIADSLANQQFTFLNRKVNRCETIDIIFFFHYCTILGAWCREIINEGGLAAVNMEEFKAHSITIPPSITEQQAIASILTSMDSELSALQAKRKKYEAIKQGMMQQLLTGKIRLI